VHVDITKGEQHTDAFRSLNPNAKVPTLVVDGTPMFEAAAILQWLGDRLGVSRGLWFSFDDPKRLEAVAWTTWAYVTPGAMLQRLNWSRGERVDPSLHHAPTAEHALGLLDRHVAILDGRLAGRTALVGERFSFVDLAVGSMITYGTYCGVSVEAYPHVKAWLARFQARPAFARAWSVDA
jgi:GST-like protein